MVGNASRFQRFSAVYACRCCDRKTRATGRGDNENVKLCAECFDLGGEENSLSDSGQFYAGADEVLSLIEAVKAKGGNAACWAELGKIAGAMQLNIDSMQRELDMRAAQGEDVSGLMVSKRSGRIIQKGGA